MFWGAAHNSNGTVNIASRSHYDWVWVLHEDIQYRNRKWNLNQPSYTTDCYILHMLFEISLDLAIMIKLCSSATLYLYTLSVIPYCNPENL